MTPLALGTISVERRLELLRGAPGFSALPARVLDELCPVLQEEAFPAGRPVVAEGAIGDRLYLVVHGRADVAVQSPSGPVPLAVLGAGEVFGELALLGAEPGARQATVTATEPLLLLSLADAEFDGLLARHPEAEAAFRRLEADLQEARFLKRASPFNQLDAGQLRRLAERIERQSVEAAEAVFREGDAGNCCYLVLSGEVEVVRASTAGEQRVAQLGPGALFGEAALLTRAPRSATVRALQPAELLVLSRDDLLELMGDMRGATRVLELLRMRDRPRRASGVEVHHQRTPEGTPVTILKDPARGRYYRLSPEGHFLWERLDGARNLRDLTMEYFRAYKAFAPGVVGEVVAGLAAAGFVELQALRPEVEAGLVRLRPWQRVLLGARRALEWQVSIGGLDPLLTCLYRGGVWVLFTRPAMLFQATLVLAGLGFFFAGASQAAQAGRHLSGTDLALFLVPSLLGALFVHELGHAFAAKAFGREVHRAGVGWYWFTPVAFVDTSDMWLSGKWPRIAVNLAGVFWNLVLAGAAAVGAWFNPSAFCTAALWQFAFFSYLGVLVNLHPLLEYDGYFVLMDWLDRPNLRRRALSWIGANLLRLPRRPELARGHALELVYGSASLLYVAAMAAVTLFSYRALWLEWVSRVLPPIAAELLAWLLTAGVVAVSLLGVLGDLRGVRSEGGKA